MVILFSLILFSDFAASASENRLRESPPPFAGEASSSPTITAGVSSLMEKNRISSSLRFLLTEASPSAATSRLHLRSSTSDIAAKAPPETNSPCRDSRHVSVNSLLTHSFSFSATKEKIRNHHLAIVLLICNLKAPEILSLYQGTGNNALPL